MAFTVIFVLFPVVAAGFVFPTSPAGMLLMRIKMRTWGYAVLVIAATFIVGYDAYLMNAWWRTQDVVRTSGYVLHQVVLSIMGFHFLPALLVSQVSTTEMIETIRQAHLVKRYKLQTDAELAILRNTTMRSVELSQRGMSNLNDRERDELARVMVGLVNGIDNTMRDISMSVKGVSSVDVGYRTLLDNPQVAGNLAVAVRYLQGGADNNEAPARGGPSGDVRKPLSTPSNDAGVTSQREGQGVGRSFGDRGERRTELRGVNQQQRLASEQRQQAPADAPSPRTDQQQQGNERGPTTPTVSADSRADGPRLLQLPSNAQREAHGAGAALVNRTAESRIVPVVAAPNQQRSPLSSTLSIWGTAC